jgi:esterase/lipase
MFIALVIIGFITALAVVPIDTSPLPSTPHPIAAYAQAVAVYDSLVASERGRVMESGGSLIYVHGRKTPRSLLLVHGITNSPRQFRELAEQFYERGYNVVVPRLPLHGLRSADVAQLKALTAEQYRDYADNAVDIASGLGDSVFVIGLSAGGNVAAWIAQHRPDVTRILVVAPALTLAMVPRLLDAPAMNLMERVPNVTIHQQPDTARPHAYFGISTRAIGETLRFGASVMASAEDAAPVVRDITLVVNENDHTIDPGSALRLAQLWRSRDSSSTMIYRFERKFGLPHDVIDATQKCGMPDIVYPVLIALMEKRAPNAIAADSGRCAARAE